MSSNKITTRYIIIAAGDMTRWRDENDELFMGVTKHMVEINGESLIHRTIRLLHERGVSDENIFLVSKDYELDGVTNVHPKLNKNNFDADKFLSSREFWNKSGRTVILYGDVYFTEDAMNTIMSDGNTDWRLFCRPTPSEILGTEWGECFAISFYKWDHKRTYEKLQQLIHLYKGGFMYRIGGWELARMIADVDILEMRDHKEDLPCYTVIDDCTDDVDYPDDYLRLKKVIESDGTETNE